MKDRLQKVADRFCAKFGLKRVRLEFAEEFTKRILKFIISFSAVQ